MLNNLTDGEDGEGGASQGKSARVARLCAPLASPARAMCGGESGAGGRRGYFYRRSAGGGAASAAVQGAGMRPPSRLASSELRAARPKMVATGEGDILARERRGPSPGLPRSPLAPARAAGQAPRKAPVALWKAPPPLRMRRPPFAP